MEPEVETRSGRIRGSEVRGIRVFRGVPYARPPVGDRRFLPPEPPQPWTDVLEAKGPGPVPVQASLPFLSFLNAGGARQSEDCLNLNIWTPGLDDARRPVLVWIHGGGFLIGAGSTAIYEGQGLSRRGDMVVVTLNYRLGALGFLHLNGIWGEEFAQASNAGVRDQIAALEWVRDNIAGFGGDPHNVTVCGQSAGAMSIGALLGSSRARKLFQHAIFQSGATRHVQSQARADEVCRVFLEELGGPAPSRQALARIPVDRILKAQGATNRRLMSLENLMCLLPCVDGEVVEEDPLAAVRSGKTKDISLLVGTTLDEWKLFAAVDSGGLPTLGEAQMLQRFGAVLANVSPSAPAAEVAVAQYREAVRSRGGQTSPFDVWNAFQSARVFHYPASLLAEAQAAAGGRAFAYLFTWRPPALRRALGACHALDIPFLFGITSHPAAQMLTGLAASTSRLSTRMQDAWASFVRSGAPGHALLPEWDPYDGESRSTMLLGRECFIADGPLEAERRLLASWIPA